MNDADAGDVAGALCLGVAIAVAVYAVLGLAGVVVRDGDYAATQDGFRSVNMSPCAKIKRMHMNRCVIGESEECFVLLTVSLAGQ